MQTVNASHDGKRLVFESTTDESHAYVAPLSPDGTLAAGRRFTLDGRYNTPYAWTPDSRSVLFSADRTGSFALYKQKIDAQIPELIPTGLQSSPLAPVSPDGAWLIYAALPNAKDPAASH
jgi:Tol biopolymer transport system component